ncbi:hypothetical protein PITC_032550 [Penicillium italicum]|uniref:Uncharacterized protein n=1 Tax=Penicillium italicum TaxID=40296 RepID=A0A0A2L773_PENIT|nr:hypothetical protein PITC_032550 [Penicillium italicum]
MSSKTAILTDKSPQAPPRDLFPGYRLQWCCLLLRCYRHGRCH